MTISNRTARTLVRQIELLFSRTTKRSTPTRRPQRTRATRSHSPGTSDEFLHNLWRNLRAEYYPDRPELDSYVVAWSSRRQKRVLASCNIRRHRVVVARELFEPTACQWIAPVLYHELCHAVIGEGVHLQSGKRQWHGAEFRALEARHPDIPAMNAWIRSGGWAMAVRSHRARQAWSRRRVASE
jgi:predicted metal-dependent hydrolase